MKQKDYNFHKTSKLISLATDLVGEWTFDEGAGSIATDSSGNGNNGTITNANWADGRVRKALNFSADESRVAIPSSPIFNPTPEITIEAWIKTNSSSRQQIILEAYGYCCHTDKNFFIQNNQLVYYARAIGSGGFAFSRTDLTLSSNQFKHVVVTAKTDERPKFYINGGLSDNPDSTQTYSPTGMHSGLGLTIGSSYNGTSQQVYEFQGLIDEVRIYKRALTAYEIKALYAQGKMRYLADR